MKKEKGELRIVFFGTPYYILPVLSALHKSFKISNKSPIVAVVTQSPKVAGRKKYLSHSEVDKWAYERHIPILFNSEDLLEQNIEADIAVLASYGDYKIPKKVINHFPHGILNIHPSNLPLFRGASPVPATIIDGSIPTVSIIKLDEKLDHGPIVTKFKDELLENDTTDSLRDRLFERSAEVIVNLIPAYTQNKIKLNAQDHGKATFTRKIVTKDAFIHPNILEKALKGEKIDEALEVKFIKDYKIDATAESLHRFILAMSSWPSVWTNIIPNPQKTNEMRLKILKAHLEPNPNKGSKKILVLDEVQLEGKTQVAWKQFTEGYPNYVFPNKK